MCIYICVCTVCVCKTSWFSTTHGYHRCLAIELSDCAWPSGRSDLRLLLGWFQVTMGFNAKPWSFMTWMIWKWPIFFGFHKFHIKIKEPLKNSFSLCVFWLTCSYHCVFVCSSAPSASNSNSSKGHYWRWRRPERTAQWRSGCCVQVQPLLVNSGTIVFCWWSHVWLSPMNWETCSYPTKI